MINLKEKNHSRAIIFGFSGTILTDEEITFFQEHKPLGFMIFKRNVESPLQVQNLINSLKEVTQNKDVLILVDEEGGRIQRLKAITKAFPAAQTFGNLYDKNPEEALKQCMKNGQDIGQVLSNLHINVVCAPVLDLMIEGAHSVIGDRAFHQKADICSSLGLAMSCGLAKENIWPVLKHIPGHGRALVDSHKKLPVVTAAKEDLILQDFLPFKNLNTFPMAMVAHVVYEDFDPHFPATLSKIMIQDVIRKLIGFEGILMSDAAEMEALQKWDLKTRAQKMIEAGIDIVLHCTGKIEEMKQMISAIPPINQKTQIILENKQHYLNKISSAL
jgi:beta-N-acetylhexosaminidase